MKKLLAIVVLGLLLNGNGMASDKKYSLFGVVIGDDINNYKPRAGIIESRLIIDPPKPNKNFVLYWAAINKKTNEIYGIGAYHKDFYPFGFEISSSGITDQQLEKAMIIQRRCKMETELFVELIVEGDQFNKFNNNLSEYDNSITSSVYIFEGEKLTQIKQQREGDDTGSNGLSDLGVFGLSTNGLKKIWSEYSFRKFREYEYL